MFDSLCYEIICLYFDLCILMFRFFGLVRWIFFLIRFEMVCNLFLM